MDRQKSRIHLIIFIFICSITMGCASPLMELSKTIAATPSFAEVEKSWLKLAPNKGRVVLYLPETVTSYALTLFVDDNYKSDLWDGLFFFVDLEAGEHIVQIYNKKEVFEFSLNEGELKFIQVNCNPLTGCLSAQIAIVREENARLVLKDVHHVDYEPLPIPPSRMKNSKQLKK